MKITGILLFDFDPDRIVEYVVDVAVGLLEAGASALLSLWNGIWSAVVEPFLQGDLISDGFWIGLLMIWLVSTMIIVNKTFGWPTK